MSRPDWTEIFAVIALTAALALLAPEPGGRRAPRAPTPPPPAISSLAMDQGPAPANAEPVTSPR